MKLKSLILMLAFGFSVIHAQSRPTRLTRPCAGTTTRSVIEIERDGDVSLIPCPGRSVLVNGSGLSGLINSINGLTAAAQTFAAPTAADAAAWSSATSTHTLQLPITAVTGSSRTNFFPYFDAANTFAKSPFSWNGTTYRFDNANSTPNTNFPISFTPQLVGSDGVFSVGSASSAQIVATQSTSTISLITPTLSISATKFTLNPLITPGGTTGNQTINQALGTVNFAAGTSQITVTNSVVTSSSLIFLSKRTNDATCDVDNVVAGSGSFVITMTANCTAETSVGFWATS